MYSQDEKIQFQQNYEQRLIQLKELALSLDASQLDTATMSELQSKKQNVRATYEKIQSDRDRKIKEYEEKKQAIQLDIQLIRSNDKLSETVKEAAIKVKISSERTLSTLYDNKDLSRWENESLDAAFISWENLIRMCLANQRLIKEIDPRTLVQRNLNFPDRNNDDIPASQTTVIKERRNSERQLIKQSSFQLKLLCTPMQKKIFLAVLSAILLAGGGIAFGLGLPSLGAALVGVGLFSVTVGYCLSGDPIARSSSMFA